MLFSKSVVLFLLFAFSSLENRLFSQIASNENELLLKLEKAIRSGSKARRIEAYSDLGKWYTDKERYGKGLTYLLRAKRLNPEDSAQFNIYYTGFAVLFRKIGAYNASIEYEKKILNLNRSSASDLAKYFSAANIGIQFALLNKPDSALQYYNLQLHFGRRMDDYIAVASAKNNQGLAYFDKKEYRNALNMFNESLRIVNENENHRSKNFEGEKKVFRYIVLENIGRCLFFLKNYEQSIAILGKTTNLLDLNVVNENRHVLLLAYLEAGRVPEARVLINRLSIGIHKRSVKERLLFVQLKIELALHNHDLSALKRYEQERDVLMREAKFEQQIFANQMSELVSRYLVWESERIIQNEKSQKRHYQNELRLEEAKNTVFTVFLIGILLLFGFSAFLYVQIVKNNKRKLALDRERLVLANERSQMKIKAQEQSLTEFAIDFNKNIEYESLIIDKLREMSQLEQQDLRAEISTLIAELRQKQQIDKRAEDLAVESENVLAGFRSALLERHPELNKSDIQLCQLLLLDLSNKEIAVIRNVEPNSIKIFKNRLKKKLNLQMEVSLKEYLKSIST